MADIQEQLQELRDGLGKARSTIKEYETFIEKVNEGALRKATLISTEGRTLPSGRQVVIQMGEGTIALPISPKMVFDDLKPGQTIWVSKEGIAVGATLPEPAQESRVVAVDGDGEALVSINGTPKLLAAAPGVREQLSIGDTVHLDAFGVVILAKLPNKTTYAVETEKVAWSDIGGLVEAKKEMIEAVEMPLTHKELFTRFNKKPTKGLLLYGPPGCGKTMLGKAAATAVAKLFGNTKTPGFFYIKGPEVLSKWVGESESNVRALFNKAREFRKNTGSPAVIFIDEAESLLRSRNSDNLGSVSIGVITTFLAEMDGLDDSGAMVLLSTNRPDSLDSAITRDGRIDKKVHVHRPSKKDTEEIFSKYLKKIPTAGGANAPDELSEELFHDKFSFYDVTLKDGEVRKFGLKDIVSGAMVAGIVESAISIAMHREIETQTKQEGVGRADLMTAIGKTFHQNKDIRHKEDLDAFTEAFKANVASVQKCAN